MKYEYSIKTHIVWLRDPFGVTSAPGPGSSSNHHQRDHSCVGRFFVLLNYSSLLFAKIELSVVKHLHKKYTNAQMRGGPPGQTGTMLFSSVCRPGPGEICRLPDESTAPADRANRPGQRTDHCERPP